MLLLNMIRPNLSYLLPLSLIVSAIATVPVKAQEIEIKNLVSQNTPDNPDQLRVLPQSNSLLSLQGGEKLMSEATTAINQQKYDLAVDKLQQARQVYNQLSNFYVQLSESFSGIENRISQGQRKKALETGQKRDEATYQLALVHRAQNKSELSVPLLIQIIRSQNPTSELGKKAYQQLFEIGFVEDPYSTSNSSR